MKSRRQNEKNAATEQGTIMIGDNLFISCQLLQASPLLLLALKLKANSLMIHISSCPHTTQASLIDRSLVSSGSACWYLPLAELLLEVLGSILLVRIVLVVLAVVLVVELLRLLASLTLGLLAVNVVGALGLSQTVDLAACETGNQLLGELVLDGLA